ncbi:periplasmic heavy metal sensor [Hymenobacter artigasi]|uniref:Periplasmic heavy metal sensor n=1 Tax=Hymenobacter artigasi TaxID=2719616 RepID=A0ABX1HPT3_9BACT|nr:periplasmic heavy metal sensor [Hymenobacter artigasi]NKI90996.1 hypothetical protein [Hymenobacter artigasi]
MTKTRILSLLVLVMGLLNVGLLALLWYGRPDHQAARGQATGPVAAGLVRELQLSPQQQQQFDVLREDHHTRMQALLKQLTARREELFAGLAQPATASAPPALLAQIGDLQRQTDSLTYAHFAAVGRLLTPAQLPRWQQLAPNLPRRLQQPPQRGGRGGLPGGPGGRGRPGDGPPPGGPMDRQPPE